VSSFQQLPLPLRFDQSCSFDHFYSNDDYVSQSIKLHIDTMQEPLLLINGEQSTGKSHLLNAAALYCQQYSVPFQFFEASMLLEYGCEVVAPNSQGSVLIIDDLHLLAKNKEWERKLYDLYNDAQRHQWLMLVSLTSIELNLFELKDWASRLKAGFNIKLIAYDEQNLNEILKLRSKILGLKLKQDVIDYLLVHFSRDLPEQIKLLRELDRQALEQNRNITIPFIKETLNI